MCVAENSSLPWIDAIVYQLSSPSLSSIIIEIWADDMQDLRSLDSECGVRQTTLVLFDNLRALNWARLASVFTGGQSAALTDVTLRGSGDSTTFHAWLRTMFPELASIVHCQRL